MKFLSLPKRQNGAALIAVLLLVSIVTVIATNLILRVQVDVERSSLEFTAEQAHLNSSYALAWATQQYTLLKKPLPANATPPLFPLILPSTPIAQGTISGSFNSAQGRFNINNLNNTAYIPLFAKLIQLVKPDLSQEQSMALAINAANFIATKAEPTLDKPYSLANPAYRPSHRLMTSPSELRLVTGFDAALYQKLMPYLIALPSTTTLNPSNASQNLLISYGITESGAAAVAAYLKIHHQFTTLEDFYRVASFSPATGNNSIKLFDVKNQFFFLTANVKVGVINQMVYSILQPNSTGLEVLQQTINTL